MNYEPLYNPQFDNHGYIQVYTGDGKGKTTASLGLILRALGRGWNILMVMFTKGGSNYGELKSFLNLDSVIKNKLTEVTTNGKNSDDNSPRRDGRRRNDPNHLADDQGHSFNTLC